MKRIITAFLIVGFASSVACADWLADFRDNYKNKSIDVAVENAMKEGVGPDIIVENGLALENLNPQNLVKALYCAGVSGKEVYEASEKYKISELLVVAGFKKSVEECGDRVTETQPYSPVNRERGPKFPPPGPKPKRPVVSVSTFTVPQPI